MFVLGDIWDNVNPKPVVVKVFFEWVKDVTALPGSPEVYVITGNHDYTRSGHNRTSMLDSLDVLELPRCSIIRDLSCMETPDCLFAFIPYTDRKQIGADTHEKAVEHISGFLSETLNRHQDKTCRIVLGHICLEGSIWVGDEVDEDRNEIFCPLDIFNGYDMVWMGHVHGYQVLREKNPHVAHIGSMDRTAFTGPGNGSKFLVCFDTDAKSATRIEIPNRKLVSIDVDIPAGCLDSTRFMIDHVSGIDMDDAIVKIDLHLLSHDAMIPDRDIVMSEVMKKAFHVCSYKEHCKVERVLVENAEVDETMDRVKAVDVFCSTMDGDSLFKQHVMDFCKSAIREIQEN